MSVEGEVEGGLREPEELEPEQGTLDLAAPGRAPERSDWEHAAAAVLRKAHRLEDDDADAGVWEELTRTTLDGIALPPLGTAELLAGLGGPVRPPALGESWDVRAHFADPDAEATASAVLTDLENGVTSLWLQVGPSGLAVDDLAGVLDKVLLHVAPVVLDAPQDPLGAARAFAEAARGVEALAPGTNLGVDPVGAVVRRTAGPGSPSGTGVTAAAGKVVDEVVGDAVVLARQLGCRALVVDGTAVHDLGGSDVQELGYVLALGAHYLRTITATGLSVGEAAGLLELRVAATDEQFQTIAKLRAVRRLWSRVLELSGVEEDHRRTVVHAVTSRPMMTRFDPWVNMLRTCVAAFAAGVGGADAVTVLPFDSRLGLPDAFARRIARNTSAVLVEESHVAKVADPAGGAYAVEKLTDDLARAGWEELGRLDGEGGVLAAVADGSLSERIAAVVAERETQIARRERPITGLTEFPDLHESLPERSPWPQGALSVRAYGEAFEALREEPVDSRVFLATMGTVAAHTARASFATNLFATGGIGVVNEGRHDDVEAVLADYSGEPVVCLTGHDKAYTGWGGALVAALREAGARWVVLAGLPPEGVEVDDTCATGLDALEFLTRTREKLQ